MNHFNSLRADIDWFTFKVRFSIRSPLLDLLIGLLRIKYFQLHNAGLIGDLGEYYLLTTPGSCHVPQINVLRYSAESMFETSSRCPLKESPTELVDFTSMGKTKCISVSYSSGSMASRYKARWYRHQPSVLVAGSIIAGAPSKMQHFAPTALML